MQPGSRDTFSFSKTRFQTSAKGSAIDRPDPGACELLLPSPAYLLDQHLPAVATERIEKTLVSTIHDASPLSRRLAIGGYGGNKILPHHDDHVAGTEIWVLLDIADP